MPGEPIYHLVRGFTTQSTQSLAISLWCLLVVAVETQQKLRGICHAAFISGGFRDTALC